MNTMYLEEFLYRGRAPDDPREPAYHVILGEVGQDGFGQRTIALSPALTPDQAREAGFPLPAIVEAVNADLMDQNVSLLARIAELEAERNAMAARIRDLAV